MRTRIYSLSRFLMPTFVVLFSNACKLDLNAIPRNDNRSTLDLSCQNTSPNPNDPRAHQYGGGTVDSNFGVRSDCVEVTSGFATAEQGVFKMRIIIRGKDFAIPYVNIESEFCQPVPGVTYQVRHQFADSHDPVDTLGPVPSGNPTLGTLLEPIGLGSIAGVDPRIPRGTLEFTTVGPHAGDTMAFAYDLESESGTYYAKGSASVTLSHDLDNSY